MFTTTAITVIVVAGAYSMFHTYQAVRTIKRENRKRLRGAAIFASDSEHTENKTDAEDTVTATPLPIDESVATDDSITAPAMLVPAEPIESAETPTSTESTIPEEPGKEQAPEAQGTEALIPQSLFQSFQGILNDDSPNRLAPPAPEELPVPDEDMTFGAATPMLAQMLPESESRRETQRQNLVAAGYHSRAAWWNLNSIRFVLAFAALIAAGFWLLLASPQTELWALGTVVAAPLLMWGIPPLLVSSKAAERKIDIERGLPDVLDMLSMNVSQGLTVPASLNRIAGEITNVHPDLSRELSIVNQQAHVGTLNQGLRNFAHRIDSPEVSSFTSLLTQSETTGTSISRALSEYSDSMRSSLRERADSQANAASFKLLFPTALCLMPAVFLFLLGPAIVDLSTFVNDTSSTLQQSRQDALETLDQQPIAVPLDN